jgi:hypothetical protein
MLERRELRQRDDRPGGPRAVERDLDEFLPLPDSYVHALAAYFDGEPWVGVETPTSSIDDKVTQAVIARGL